MFAIIEAGGKQYCVSVGDIIKVEKLSAIAGDVIRFSRVLMVDSALELEVITKTTVVGKLLEQVKLKKDIIFKKNRRHNYRRKRGHRQQVSVVRITDIVNN